MPCTAMQGHRSHLRTLCQVEYDLKLPQYTRCPVAQRCSAQARNPRLIPLCAGRAQVLINAGQANAATGDAGYQDCLESADAVASALNISPDEVRCTFNLA